MMKLRLLRFGICRDIVNHEYAQLTQDHISVSAFRQFLFDQYPALIKLNSLAIAVDEEYRDDDYLLKDGDEVVLIPPVSGG